MLGIQIVGAVSFNSQIFYFPIKLWVQMPGAAKLQKYDCAVCFKTQISAQPAASIGLFSKTIGASAPTAPMLT